MEKPAIDLIQDGKIGKIGKENGGFDDIGQRKMFVFKDVLDVDKDLFRLRRYAHFGRVLGGFGWIEGDLPRAEEKISSPDGMAVRANGSGCILGLNGLFSIHGLMGLLSFVKPGHLYAFQNSFVRCIRIIGKVGQIDDHLTEFWEAQTQGVLIRVLVQQRPGDFFRTIPIQIHTQIFRRESLDCPPCAVKISVTAILISGKHEEGEKSKGVAEGDAICHSFCIG